MAVNTHIFEFNIFILQDLLNSLISNISADITLERQII